MAASGFDMHGRSSAHVFLGFRHASQLGLRASSALAVAKEARGDVAPLAVSQQKRMLGVDGAARRRDHLEP